jgi:hypothetical protein
MTLRSLYCRLTGHQWRPYSYLILELVQCARCGIVRHRRSAR